MHRADVSEVVNACDAGREGELIFRFVYEMAGCKKPMRRLWISSMEDSAIKEGFSRLKNGEEYDALFASALCRAKADWLIGINATRLFSVLYNHTLNVGRVQTPTLKMLVDRDAAITTFKKEKYYHVRLALSGAEAASERISDKAEADALKTTCEASRVVCTSLVKEKKTIAPPKPFDLTSLQREANRLFGYTAKQTLDLAQALYEKRLLTYPRTDSAFLTDDMGDTAAGIIKLLCGKFSFMAGMDFAPELAKVLNSKKVSDHHAIIPTMELAKTDLAALPESERNILVAGFTAWKNNFQRNVIKGEKGIKIIAPSPFKVKQQTEKIDPHTRKPVMGKDGKPVMEEKEVTIPAYKVVSVFDVSQTEGKELPDIAVDELTGDVDRYKDFFIALEKTSPVPIGFEKIIGGAHGYYHLEDKRIAIDEGMSELQTLKTAIHEIAHAKLHDIDLNAPKDEQQPRVDRRTREVEAESVAYTVCQHYGLDTSDYSFGYVAGWSSGRELAELKGSLETIRSTAAEIINSIDEHIAQIQKEQDKEQAAPAQEQPEQEVLQDKDTFSIYQINGGDETRDLRFEPYDRLTATGHRVDPKNYALIYSADLTPGTSLEDIYTRFNIDHPKDFKGHSLSVSDVVVLHQNGQDTAHYVDSFGYKDVPEFFKTQEKALIPDNLETGETIKTPRGTFYVTAMSREQMEAAGYGLHHQSDDGKYLIMGNGTRAFAVPVQPENYLKAAEQTTEQNYNMIDGQINNTPTVAELEAKVKAGETISLVDLAEAVKADKERGKAVKTEKKPSIRAQLRADKEKTAQKKAAKTKNHELEV